MEVINGTAMGRDLAARALAEHLGETDASVASIWLSRRAVHLARARQRRSEHRQHVQFNKVKSKDTLCLIHCL